MERRLEDSDAEYSFRHYRDVCLEGMDLISRDSDPGNVYALLRSISSLFYKNKRDFRGVWKEGEGEVRESTIEAVEEMKRKAERLVEASAKAHGNSHASNYEYWGSHLLNDLERLDLEPVDWEERTEGEKKDARKTSTEVTRKVARVSQKVAALQNELEELEGTEEGYSTAREVRRELNKMSESLDDLI